ncbi:hypothetical protein [uncultured Ligilactobacillus sp.]|nr:hypothetical protein [uncultured Ligilactobacillus sp.]
MVEKEKRLGNQDPAQSAILPFRDGTVSGIFRDWQAVVLMFFR